MGTVEPIRKISDLRKMEKILKKQNLRNLLIFDIGINCGLRISDILALNVKDVKNKNYIQLIEKKTNKKRIIPLNKKLKEIIKNYTKNKNDDIPLFTSIFNNRLDRFFVYKMLNNASKKAKLELKIGTHTLRKTFGYHHYKKFKDIALLQKIFNHSSCNITMRYIGIDDDEIFNSYKNFIL